MSGLQHQLEALDEQRSLENLRYELRCTVEPSRLGELLNWIALHRAGFRTAYPDRTVNNVYFDTLLLLIDSMVDENFPAHHALFEVDELFHRAPLSVRCHKLLLRKFRTGTDLNLSP